MRRIGFGLLLVLTLALAAPAAAEFPTAVIFFTDGSTRTLSPLTIATDWALVPETGIVSVRLNLPNNQTFEYQLSGADLYWAYLETANTYVFGARRPQIGQPGDNDFTPGSLTEVVFDRRQGRPFVEREVLSVPAAATVKRWDCTRFGGC